MANSSQKMVVLATSGLLCILVLAMLNGAQAACGNFIASCDITSRHIRRSVLSASCTNTNGDCVNSELDLNRYLGNNNGNLVPGSNFSASCTTLEFVLGFNVYALCTKLDGITQDTSYDLQNNVVNSNGILAWNNCRRRSLLESTPVDAAHEDLADQDHYALGGRKMLH